MTDNPHLAALADTLREVVELIEAKAPTTRNHYGDHMGVLSMAAHFASERTTLAKALILAGANGQGVADALRVS